MNHAPKNAKMDPRIFIAICSTGIFYSDRSRSVNGDYAFLGAIYFSDLRSEISSDCPTELRTQIEADMANYRARKGEELQTSGSGQTVTLGYDVLDAD